MLNKLPSVPQRLPLLPTLSTTFSQMFNPFSYPILVFVASLCGLWISGWIGGAFRRWQRKDQNESNEDFDILLGATLTLLGLIIGFTFSMAVGRYDQRKNLEEQEANAIGTEYVRADLLPVADAAKVRALLKSYLDQRILLYLSPGGEPLRRINAQTAQLQNQMWSAVAASAGAQPTPVAALVLAGMNDVLNSQGYTQAAWWNRIPVAAWTLLIAMSIFCNLLMGYRAQGKSRILFMILPVALSISLFLIADIDSPRRGVIRVHPQNLESLASSLNSSG
ncbi:MAG TPA: hypothetical protein VGJ06_21810 [Candidatus Acidoferrum sp.]